MNRRLWSNRNFVALWLGQAVSSIGDYFSLLAVPIFVNRLTGSMLLVGLCFISVALPALVLGPLAGVFVDRFDRRKVMIAADVLRGLLTLGLLTVQDASQVWVVYLVGFLISCSSQFFNPARAAALPLIVSDPQDWLAANGLMRVLQTVGMLAGPALAGTVIGLWGERVAFGLDGASFLVSAAALWILAVPRTTPGSASIRAVWGELREGAAFLLGSRSALGVLICLTMAAVGFTTVNMIWIPYLQRQYGVGAAGLGLADAALGVGMLLSGLCLGRMAQRVSKTLLGAGGLTLIGVQYITIVLLPAFGWILAWQFVSGLLLVPMQSALDTILQLAVPDLKRGRVNSSINAAYNAAGMLAMGFGAVFGDVVGLQAVFVLVGAFVLAAGLVGFKLLKEPEVARPVVEIKGG